MNKTWIPVVVTSLALVGCAGQGEPEADHDEPVGEASEALTGVAAPTFNLPNTAFYCDVIWPSAGGSYWLTAYGDYNTSPCGSGAVGSKVMRPGMITNNSWNIAEEWCDPNYYWVWQKWGGVDAINGVTGFAANTQTNGNCYFKVTLASSLRGVEDTIPALNYWSDPANSYAIPTPSALPHTGKTFNVAAYMNAITTAMASPPSGFPQPVGYQVSVRAPLSVPYPAGLNSGLLISLAVGNVVGTQPLPSGSTSGMGNPAMTTGRRFDLASMAKTITAVATMAAFDDMAAHGNPQHVTLESSINPYLQMIWPGGVDASLQPITFRDLLRHTTPLCSGGRNPGNHTQDSYLGLKTLLSQGPNMPGADGNWQPGATSSEPGIVNYCDRNYALLRVLVPLVLEGGAAFHNADGSAMTDTQIDQLTSSHFRNYVRSKIFAPLGLTHADTYNTVDIPETIYFNSAGTAIPDQVNVGVGANWGYDERANSTVSWVGSGFFYLSADEYSFFLANLWAGNILPISTVQKMLTPGTYNLGMDGRGSLDGLPTFGKNGGGGGGGPTTQWVTFPDGYVAVILSNSPGGNLRAILENNYDAAWQPMYHGWTSPVPGCSTASANTSAPTADGGSYPYNTGDSAACKAWKLAATICNAPPVAYGYATPGDWSCPSSGGFTDPNFGTYCAVSNQYVCSDCYGACNASCIYTPLSVRNCSGNETTQQ